jgi:threonine aldolase
LLGGRLVVHYQIGEEAIGKLEGLMREVLRKGGDVEVDGKKEVVDKMKLNVE